jgi:hypothetical protein
VSALNTGEVPVAMRAALETLDHSGSRVRIAFREVPEVPLTKRGPSHSAACVLDPDEFQKLGRQQ